MPILSQPYISSLSGLEMYVFGRRKKSLLCGGSEKVEKNQAHLSANAKKRPLLSHLLLTDKDKRCQIKSLAQGEVFK